MLDVEASQKRLCKKPCENTVSQDLAQNMKRQNTLNKIIIKKRRSWDSKLSQKIT